MNTDSIVLIRDSIRLALLNEAHSQALLRFLEELTPKLHQAIELPENQPARYLLTFVEGYIQRVPDIIETLAQTADLIAGGPALITIVIDFFIDPHPAIDSNAVGLYGLLDKAYLAHRLFEEINDRFLLASGTPLIPIDMTLANILVHDLLGEGYGNQLDLVVHFAVESLMNHTNFARHLNVAGLADHGQWQQILKQWPPFPDLSAIHLKLPNPLDQTAKLH